MYSITPPSGTYEYVKLKRGSSKDGDGTNTTNGIDFSSTTSNNLLKGWNTSNSTGDWGEIHPSPVTSDGTGILYFNMAPGSNNSNIDYDFLATKNFAFFYNNDHGEWSDQAVRVTDNYYRVHVPQGTWSGVILTRHGDVSSPDWSNVYQNNDGKKNQSTDITFTDNHNYISAWYENKYAGVITATMSDYVPSSTYVLNGSMNGWNMLSAKYFDEGSLELSLPAHKTYSFKIIEGNGGSGTWKGLYDSNCIVSTMSKWGCSGSVNIPINTAGAGTYTFEYSSDDGLSVTYPTASHPNMDYVYLRNYGDWANPHVHFEGTSASGVAGTSGGGQQLKGLSSPSTITNTTSFTILGNTEDYYYCAVGDFPQVNLHNNDGGSNESGNKDVERGHRLYHDGKNWVWGTLPIWIGLDRRGANNGDDHIDTEFNAPDHLPSSITTPTKDNYEFGGYYTGWNSSTNEVAGTQIIDKNGDWIVEAVPGYKGESGEWIHEGSVSLYAKWTEIKHDVTVAVSPAGAGSVQVSGSPITKVENIGFETHSPILTAVPTNAAWVFKEWRATAGAHLQTGTYTTTGTTMEITATSDDQTLTAVFEKRYDLLGSKYESDKAKASMTTGGMPGWTYGSGADFTINSYEADGDNATVELVCERILDAGTYMFEIHDRRAGKSLGRKNGSAIYELGEGEIVELRDGDDKDQSVFFYPQGAGKYIFKITYMTKSGDTYYPTVEILRPHQSNFGTGYAGIDDLSSVTLGTTGGTLSVDTAGTAISTGAWVTYGADVNYDPTAAPGYTFAGFYTSNAYSDENPFTTYDPWMNYNVTSTDNAYAKFTEKATSVTLSKTGKGTITVGGSDFTWDEATTCGVTTTRALEATAATGYTFTSWSLSTDPDFQLDDKSSDDDNTVTLKGKGSGIAGTLTANFSAKTYSVKLNNDHGGESSDDGSATATYDATSLSSITDAKFSDWTLLGYWNNSGVQVVNADGSLIANVGGFTDSDGKWIKDAGETVNLYAHWSRTYTINSNGGTTNGSVTVTYNSADATVTAPVWSGYTLERVYADEECTNKLMEANGHLIDYTGYVSSSKWTKKDDATLYAKWVKVIYRTGDKTDGDTHHPAAGGSVESYSGDAIPVTIEYRMKVDEIGKWYTLCLPFDVEAVRVWDGEDGRYYDLVPYYRSGDKYIKGHYVIRKPDFKTVGVDSIAISRFGEWVDPTSSAFTPVANTPYTIQWPNLYFENRYVSFFGTSTKSSWGDMTVGDAPTDDAVVNVYGNDAMTSGSVHGAYMLDNDYGVGAWLRLEEEEEDEDGRSIPPFECYILASGATTPLYVAIRPGMTIVDTPTGWDAISNPAEKATKVLIDGQLYIYRDGQMYTVQGTLVK